MKVERVSSGSEPIDSFLNGGIEKEIITNIFGESGSGKTNFCIQIAGELAGKGEKVAYIDTEKGFSAERFIQVASEEALENIVLMEPMTFDQQEKDIESLHGLADDQDISAVVVDSLVSLYRLNANGDNISEVNQRLSKQLSELSKIARKEEIPVIVTNQVYTNFDEEGIELVGRDVPRYWSKCLLKLSNEDKNLRRIEVEKHRSLPEGKSTRFQITDDGLVEPDEKGLF
ncbi:MAG: DNA repair and recombination protein RadB [Candidatus Aenigmatarchaeota archaeon]